MRAYIYTHICLINSSVHMSHVCHHIHIHRHISKKDVQAIPCDKNIWRIASYFAHALLHTLNHAIHVCASSLSICHSHTHPCILRHKHTFNTCVRSKTLTTVTIYGGASYIIQENELRRGVDVVVGTPGRVIDMIDKGHLRLDQVRMFILDEAGTTFS